MKAVRSLVPRRVWKVAFAAMLGIGVALLRALASQSRGSIEGIVVRSGTIEPISSVDVEMTRIERTKAFPLAEPTYLTDARIGPTFPTLQRFSRSEPKVSAASVSRICLPERIGFWPSGRTGPT